jgi:hypothetical protein
MAAGPEVFADVPVTTEEATSGTNSTQKGLAAGGFGFIGCAMIGLVCLYSSVIGIGRSVISRTIGKN